MADTIITNTPEREIATDNGVVGLIVAIIAILALLVLGYFLFRHAPGVPNTGSTNVNVTLPSDGDTGAGSSAGGGLTGSVNGGSTSGQ